MEAPPKFGVVLGVATVRILQALRGFGGTQQLRELHSAHGSQLDCGSAGMLQAENFSYSHDGPELDREVMLLLEVPLLLAMASGAFTRFWELALALGVSPGLSQGLMSAPVVEAWFRCEFL